MKVDINKRKITMRIAIVEDEISQQQIVEKYAVEWGKMKQVQVESFCFINSESFLFFWEEDKQFDLLILDIEMGAMNGLELAKKLRREGEEIPVLFVTGYEEYSRYGYDVSALHYLIKPLQKEKFFQVLNRLFLEKEKEEKKLLLDTTEGKISISPDKIWYVEAAAHQCQLFMEQKQMMLKTSLGKFEETIKERTDFVKCHRSYLVNLRHVSAVGKAEVFLDDGRSIPLSRTMVKYINTAFVRYYKES